MSRMTMENTKFHRAHGTQDDFRSVNNLKAMVMLHNFVERPVNYLMHTRSQH